MGKKRKRLKTCSAGFGPDKTKREWAVLYETVERVLVVLGDDLCPICTYAVLYEVLARKEEEWSEEGTRT